MASQFVVPGMRRFLAPLVISILAASCSSSTPKDEQSTAQDQPLVVEDQPLEVDDDADTPETFTFDQGDLAGARDALDWAHQQWQAADLDGYVMRVANSCGCRLCGLGNHPGSARGPM